MKNRFHRIKSLLVIFIGLIALGTFCVSTTRAQCPLMTVSQTNVDELTPADIDFEHFESHAPLFTINIADPCSQHFDLILRGSIDIFLADGTLSGNAGMFTTDPLHPFHVDPPGKTISNMDLGRSGTISTKFSFDDNAKQRLQDVSLSTGRFPAGQYVLHLQLLDANSNPLSPPVDGDVRFDLKNISRIELRSPRDGETTNEFPLFEFYQDGDHAVLTVAEKFPDQSREDAISRKPSMTEVDLVGQNSFLYAGGRPLEDGKTYVWKVVSKKLGSGGIENEVSSTIGSFTVSATGGEGVSDAILNQLEEMMGPRYAPLFNQLRAGGFHLTGTYGLNGSSLTQSELLNLVNQLREIADSAELSLE